MAIAASSARLALEIGGAVLVLVALCDMFLTIFNYDGFSTLTAVFHRGWWAARSPARCAAADAAP